MYNFSMNCVWRPDQRGEKWCMKELKLMLNVGQTMLFKYFLLGRTTFSNFVCLICLFVFLFVFDWFVLVCVDLC